MSEEAKGCPFCGDLPTVEPQGDGLPPWVVSCDNFDCPANPVIQHPESEAEAIAAWNRRPSPPVVDGELWQRDEMGRAMQNIFSRFWPDDYEEAWPVKAMYAVADAILDGSFDKMIAVQREVRHSKSPRSEGDK